MLNIKECVGMMLSKYVTKSLIEWTPVSERIIIARFKTRIANVAVIQCYAPTEVI
jgi:hypothetical protein